MKTLIYPLADYYVDPVLTNLIKRSRAAMAMLSVGKDENPELRLGIAKALRKALEAATGEDFGEFDFSDWTREDPEKQST